MRGRGALGGQGGAGAPLGVLVLSLCFLLTRAQTEMTTTISVNPSKPIEGGDVSLTPASVPTNTLSCRWFRGGNAVTNNTVYLFYFFPSPTPTPGANYTGRETMDSNCSLHITNLAGNYSGTYLFSLEIIGGTVKGEAKLIVSENISKPIIPRPLIPYPTENIDTLQLTCNTSAVLANVAWLFNGQPLLENDTRVHLSDNNRTLEIRPVLRSDAGDYQCHVYNLAFNETSNAFHIPVVYGPDPPVITPSQEVYYEHMDIKLSCAADCSPPAKYTWIYNGWDYGSGEDLMINNVSPTWSGNYTCQAKNDFSGNKASRTLNITVVAGGVYGVSIQGPHNVIEPNPVTLQCTSFGFNVSYYWLKGNKSVNANGHISLTNNSQILTLENTTKEDTGLYTCFGNNSFSANESLPFELRVYYGPDSVIIEPRQQLYLANTNLSLTCKADSDPPAMFTWYFSNDSLPIGNDAQYVIPDLSISDSGTYYCNASNAKTGLSNTSSVQVTVLEPVRNVNITSNPSKVVEGTATTLTCNADGTEVSYFWSKEDQILESDDRISLSDDNRNLTFNATVQSDSGNYTCYANNSLSNSSNTHFLDVFYGPREPIISPNTTFYATGSRLNLTCTADSNPPAQFTWRFKDDTHNGSNWLIDNLTLSQAGNYTCVAFNEETGWNSSRFLEIEVMEPVSNVSIIITPLKTEENDVVTLYCSAAKGTEVSYFWLKGDQVLESNDRISLSDDNRNVTFNRVLHSDSDNYTCYANNSLSSNSSTYFLNVLYGPGVPLILPDKTRYKTGDLLSLSCSADSNPLANYTWHYGEGKVFQGSNLTPFNLTLDDTGYYNCTASNDQTGRSETRAQKIEVVEDFDPPILTPSSYLPLEKENVTLECNTSSSKYITVSWRKDDKDTLPENAKPSTDNKTLTIYGFTQKDNGSYTCVASNLLFKKSSNPSVLSMAYGPNNAKIVQSGDFTLRSNVSLLCSADSNPTPQFRWFFNNSETKETKPTYSIISATLEDTGVYRCQAFNPTTNTTASANVTMQIKKPDDTGGDTGLSGGAIAGIVIGCLAAVILIAGLLYYVCTRTSVGRTERHASNGNVPSAPGHNQGATDSKPRMGDEDIQYSTLAFNASHPPQPAPAAGQASDGATIYSEIRKK